MNKKGFTLIELLVVLAIISIASAGSILVFDRADNENNKKELRDMYTRIQRAALSYLDMNDSWRNQFNDKEYIFLKINELQNENYVDHELIDPTTFSQIDSNNLIYVYLDKRIEEKVDTCIVKLNGTKLVCVANADGDACNCCLGAEDGTFAANANPEC